MDLQAAEYYNRVKEVRLTELLSLSHGAYILSWIDQLVSDSLIIGGNELIDCLASSVQKKLKEYELNREVMIPYLSKKVKLAPSAAKEYYRYFCEKNVGPLPSELPPEFYEFSNRLKEEYEKENS